MPIGFGEDSLAGYTFHLEVDGFSAAFKKVSGLESELSVIEEKEMLPGGILNYKVTPGQPKWPPVVAEQGLTKDSLQFWQWHEDAKLDIWSARKNGSVVIYGYNGSEEVRFNFERGWPSKVAIAGADAGQPGESIQNLSITIVHEGLKKA